MPIIGPILFSLFIFSPFILPTSDTDKKPELASDSIVDEANFRHEDLPPIAAETSHSAQDRSLLE